jgi:hypothetical protein
MFAERQSLSLIETRLLERLFTALPKGQRPIQGDARPLTHLTHKASPTPLPSKSLNSLHPIPNTLLTLLTLWHPQAYMTGLAIGMSLVHREPNTIVSEFSIPRNTQFARTSRRPRDRVTGRCEEGVSTFGTEKVLLVISAFAKCGIIQGDEPLVDNGRFTRVTARGKTLSPTSTCTKREKKDYTPHDSPNDNTASRRAHTNSHAPIVHGRLYI